MCALHGIAIVGELRCFSLIEMLNPSSLRQRNKLPPLFLIFLTKDSLSYADETFRLFQQHLRETFWYLDHLVTQVTDFTVTYVCIRN